MANYISQVMTPNVSTHLIKDCAVPVGGMKAGSIVVLDTIDAAISGNFSVFTAGAITADSIKGKNIGIVLNDGFETLADGRRPAGQPNYFMYEHQDGETMPVALIHEGLIFNYGVDCVESGSVATAVVGNFLIPTVGATAPTAVATVPADTNGAMKIVALYNTPIGGNFGAGFAKSLVCIPV